MIRIDALPSDQEADQLIASVCIAQTKCARRKFEDATHFTTCANENFYYVINCECSLWFWTSFSFLLRLNSFFDILYTCLMRTLTAFNWYILSSGIKENQKQKNREQKNKNCKVHKLKKAYQRPKLIKMKSIILQRIFSLFTYYSPGTTALLVILTVYYVTFKLRRRRMESLLAKVPGPAPLPIIGNLLEISTGFDRNIKFKLNSLTPHRTHSVHIYLFSIYSIACYKNPNWLQQILWICVVISILTWYWVVI